MRKVIWLLTIFAFCTGCAVSRKHIGGKEKATVVGDSVGIQQSVKNQNLTNYNFYIDKAEFSIKGMGFEKSGIATIKFMIPDKYMISLKSNTGIEIARVFITEDSIKVNDRLNKKLYFGSSEYLNNKFGIGPGILPLIFGDYVNDEISGAGKMDCEQGRLNINGDIKNLRVKYLIDCQYAKTIMALPSGFSYSNGLKISYDRFFRLNGINIPGLINVSENQHSISIEIKIQRIIFPWEGSIEFFPGKQYEKIPLL